MKKYIDSIYFIAKIIIDVSIIISLFFVLIGYYSAIVLVVLFLLLFFLTYMAHYRKIYFQDKKITTKCQFRKFIFDYEEVRYCYITFYNSRGRGHLSLFRKKQKSGEIKNELLPSLAIVLTKEPLVTKISLLNHRTVFRKEKNAYISDLLLKKKLYDAIFAKIHAEIIVDEKLYSKYLLEINDIATKYCLSINVMKE